jgi:hypothetical protein
MIGEVIEVSIIQIAISITNQPSGQIQKNPFVGNFFGS